MNKVKIGSIQYHSRTKPRFFMIRKKPGEKTVIDRDSFNITRPTLKDKGRAEDIEITERLKAVLQKYREIESNE